MGEAKRRREHPWTEGLPFERHQYPPMLGPLEAVPVGTPAWAERLGLRILNAVETTEQHGVDRLIPWIEMALGAKQKPWQVGWPEDRPRRTPDQYLKYVAGVDCISIAKLIAAYRGETDPLVRRLLRSTAEAEAEIAHENKLGGVSLREDTTKVRDDRNTTGYWLRRLAREAPDILARYERGDFKTATAAARAAGFKVGPTELQKLHRAWRHATPEQRASFLAEIRIDRRSARDDDRQLDGGVAVIPELSCISCGSLLARRDVREIVVPDAIGTHGPFCAGCAQSAEGLTFAEWLDNQWQRQRPH